MEQEWLAALRKKPPETVSVNIEPVYKNDSMRPDRFIVKYSIADGDFKRTIIKNQKMWIKMELEKLDTLYREIAQTIDEMIPKEWEEVCLYAEILDDSAEINFYYKLMGENEYRYSHNIPEDHNVSESIYNEFLIKLHDLFEELQQAHGLINPEKWTNLTMKLDANGKFSLDLNYEDVLNQEINGSQRRAIWAYENLGIHPKRKSVREFLDQYIKNKQ